MTIMARPASGEEHLELARNAVRIAKTADELRSAQALLLPLESGLSLEQTAIAIGRSKGKTCTLRTNYCKRATGRMAAPVAKRNLRNRANRSLEEEKVLLQEVFDSAGVGGVLVVAPFADKLRQKMGVPLSLAAIYRMLARHGWRKIAPDTTHPKGDLLVREDWKKTPRGAGSSDSRVCCASPHAADVSRRSTIWPHQRLPSRMGASSSASASQGYAYLRVHLRLCDSLSAGRKV